MITGSNHKDRERYTRDAWATTEPSTTFGIGSCPYCGWHVSPCVVHSAPQWTSSKCNYTCWLDIVLCLVIYSRLNLRVLKFWKCLFNCKWQTFVITFYFYFSLDLWLDALPYSTVDKMCIRDRFYVPYTLQWSPTCHKKFSVTVQPSSRAIVS